MVGTTALLIHTAITVAIVVGLIDIPPAPAGVRLQHIDVATGQPWLPPAS